MEHQEIDQFIAKVVSQNDSFRITIPKRLAEFAGINVDDTVKVWFKKIEKITEEDKEENK